MEQQNHLVYILYSQKINRYYTGYTSNINIRLEFHEDAEVHKFTYNADDWQLIFRLECKSKAQGLAIEKHIKSMKSKIYIDNLIKYPEMQEKLLIKYIPDG